MSTTTRQHNCAIDIFRYVCAVLIVAIHTHLLMDVNANLGFVFTHMITRIGVPFFFCVAGYFYIGKLEAGKKSLWKYVKRLVIVYSLWTVLYYALDFVQYGRHDIVAYLKDCVYYYFIAGSRGHFWFFPALIYTVFMVTALWKLGGKKIVVPLGVLLYGICCLGSAYYYGIGNRIPVLNRLFLSEHWEVLKRIFLTGFPFFGCGYLIRQLEKRITTKKATLWLLVVSTLLWLGEMVLVKELQWQKDVVTTPFLYLEVVAVVLFLLKHPLSHCEKQANACRVVANFTYYSHPFVIICINLVSQVLLQTTFTETPMFLLTTILCGIAGWIVYRWNNKYVNYLV